MTKDHQSIIFVDIPQIPNACIVYRLPEERDANPNTLNFSHYELDHIPLFEGEERLNNLILADTTYL